MCGAEVLAFLAEVAFGGRDGFVEMLGDKGGGKTGPGREVASVNGLEPGGLDWAEAGPVQVVDEVVLCSQLVDVVGMLTGEWLGRCGLVWRGCLTGLRAGEIQVPQPIARVTVAAEADVTVAA